MKQAVKSAKDERHENLTLNDLAREAAKQDGVAFELLVLRCQPIVRAFCLSLCRSYKGDKTDAAYELMADFFRDLPRTILGFRGDGSFQGWAYRTLKNRRDSFLRQQWVRFDEQMSEAFDSSSPSTDVSGIEITLELEEALAVLSPRQRAAFILIRLLGYKPKEVAEMWGLAGTSSISRTLDRALYKLRNNISTERSFRLPVARATNKKAEIDG